MALSFLTYKMGLSELSPWPYRAVVKLRGEIRHQKVLSAVDKSLLRSSNE